MRYALVFFLMLGVLAVTATARAATERPDLEARLPVSHPVFCADSMTEWDRLTVRLGPAVAYTWMAGPLIHQMFFSPDTCAALADTDGAGFADAAQTLYHEWFHSHFEMRDEGAVECHSLFIFRYALRHFWGMSAQEAQRSYRRAFTAHTVLGFEFPAYRGDCTYPQSDPVS